MNYQNTSKELIVKFTKGLKLPALKDCLEDVVTERMGLQPFLG